MNNNTNGQTTIETTVILDDALAAQLQEGFNESGLSKEQQDIILGSVEDAVKKVEANIMADQTLTPEQKVNRVHEAYKLIVAATVDKTKAFRKSVRYASGTGVVYSGYGLQKTGRGLQYIGKKVEDAGDKVVKFGLEFRDPTVVTDSDVALLLTGKKG